MRFSLPALLPLLVGVVLFWRAGQRRSGARVAVWRSAIAALLVLSASGLQVRGGTAPLSIMFVLDRSDSVDHTEALQLDRLRSLTDGMQPGDRAGLVVFGADVALERRLAPNFRIAGISSVTSGAGTDIEAAVRTARTALAGVDSPRIVLLSDGQQTRGDVIGEAARAAANGVPIDVVPPLAATPPYRVVRLGAPPLARVDEPFVLTASVQGPPGAEAVVTLDSDRETLAEREVILSAYGIATATFSTRSSEQGERTFRATVRPLADARGDTATALGPAGAVVTVTGRPRLLYVGGRNPGPRAALAANGFVLELAQPRAIPSAAAQLAGYDGVVLDDVGRDALDATRASALADYVEQLGGGLLVLGSARSLEPALSAVGPLGRILPVDLRPRSGQRSADLALVVVFDKSGSMEDRVDGVQKIDFARQSVQRALEAVSVTDLVGVIAFDSSAVPVAPLQARYDAASMGRRLGTIRPGGPTAIAPAIELARDWLNASTVEDAARRHVLLISDGRTSPPDIARLQALSDGREFTLSVVALGSGEDRRVLTSVAESTGGRAFFPENVRDVPLLVSREVARVSGGRFVEQPFVVRASSHPVLSGLTADALPELTGYVVSTLRPTAEAVLRSSLDDPVLATWRAGLGRVGVYTADLDSPWSSGLRAWGGFNRLFTQTVRYLSRQVEQGSMAVALQPADDGGRIVLEAFAPDGRPLVLSDVRATLRRPSGVTEDFHLAGTGPGRYEAAVPVLESGAHLVLIESSGRDGSGEGRIARGFYVSAEREYRSSGVNRALLSEVARMTGGRVLAAGESAFGAGREPSYRSARPWLALAALFLFLLEVVVPGGVRPLDTPRLKGSDPGGAGREEAA